MVSTNCDIFSDIRQIIQSDRPSEYGIDSIRIDNGIPRSNNKHQVSMAQNLFRCIEIMAV